MANPLLLDIVLYLKSVGLVTDGGIDIFRDFTPESPDDVVSLIEYKGDPESLVDKNVVNRSVQVTVRNVSADIARQKSLQIYKALQTGDTIVKFTPDRWGQVYLRQSPIRISTDANHRVTYGFNVGITTTID